MSQYSKVKSQTKKLLNKTPSFPTLTHKPSKTIWKSRIKNRILRLLPVPWWKVAAELRHWPGAWPAPWASHQGRALWDHQIACLPTKSTPTPCLRHVCLAGKTASERGCPGLTCFFHLAVCEAEFSVAPCSWASICPLPPNLRLSHKADSEKWV